MKFTITHNSGILRGMQTGLKSELATLQEGHTQKIQGSFDPALLEVHEADLSFLDPIQVKGEVYLSEDDIIIHLSASTQARMPCLICNQMTPCALRVVDFRHVLPLKEISDPYLDVSVFLREALLLELPKTLECNQGNCPERKEIAPYLAPADKQSTSKHHFPFANM